MTPEQTAASLVQERKETMIRLVAEIKAFALSRPAPILVAYQAQRPPGYRSRAIPQPEGPIIIDYCGLLRTRREP